MRPIEKARRGKAGRVKQTRLDYKPSLQKSKGVISTTAVEMKYHSWLGQPNGLFRLHASGWLGDLWFESARAEFDPWGNAMLWRPRSMSKRAYPAYDLIDDYRTPWTVDMVFSIVNQLVSDRDVCLLEGTGVTESHVTNKSGC